MSRILDTVFSGCQYTQLKEYFAGFSPFSNTRRNKRSKLRGDRTMFLYYVIRICTDDGRVLPRPEIVGVTDQGPEIGHPLQVAYMAFPARNALDRTDWVCDQCNNPGTKTGNVTGISREGDDAWFVHADRAQFLMIPGIIKDFP